MWLRENASAYTFIGLDDVKQKILRLNVDLSNLEEEYNSLFIEKKSDPNLQQLYLVLENTRRMINREMAARREYLHQNYGY